MYAKTFLFADDIPEKDIARLLEEEFDAGWFPEYHRCTIMAEVGYIAVDTDRRFVERLPADEREALVAQIGFLPHSALHIEASRSDPAADHLAERVAAALSLGRVVAPLPAMEELESAAPAEPERR